MNSMNSYREGVLQNDPILKKNILKAVQTLDLSGLVGVLSDRQGKEAAVFLKEIIDRIAVFEPSKIPDTNDLTFWELEGTEIIIQRIEKGNRKGEYLFSSDTVKNSHQYYQSVKELPYLSESGGGAGYSSYWLEDKIPRWLQKSFLSLQWWQWIGIFLSILIGLIIRMILSFSIATFLQLQRRTEKKNFYSLLTAIQKPLSFLAACSFWFLCLFTLQFKGIVLVITTAFLQIIFSSCLIYLFYSMVNFLSIYLKKITFTTESKLDDQLAPLITKALKIFILTAGFLTMIQNLGINVASLIAGLGLGGLAFALAARDTVANFFGSLMIIFDRPFQIGDWIKIGDSEGIVEDIGFRSTRIRTFYNSLISVPNSKTASSQIDNFGARKYRRSVAHLSVTYGTPSQKITAFLEGIKNIIKSHPNTRKDYYHVVFKDYGAHGLNLMAYFFLEVSSWGKELRERQEIYLSIYRLAEEIEINFAFPTQTLHIESLPEEFIGQSKENQRLSIKPVGKNDSKK